MAEALADVTIAAPAPTLIANVTAAPVADPEAIRKLLVEQVTGLVRWRECVLRMMKSDVDTLVELGAGKVLANLARRIDKAVSGIAVLAPADVESLIAA